jgi:multidrug resistance efflux pump
MSYKFELRSSLDVVFNQFFLQIKDFTFEDGRYIEKGELERLIKIKQEIEELESKIKLAEAKVKSTKQINRELEYYQEQKKLERQLRLKKKSLMKSKSGILP